MSEHQKLRVALFFRRGFQRARGQLRFGVGLAGAPWARNPVPDDMRYFPWHHQKPAAGWPATPPRGHGRRQLGAGCRLRSLCAEPRPR